MSLDVHDLGTHPELADLSPMAFASVEWAGRRLRIEPPLTIEPTLDEDSGRLLVLIHDELGIDVFAESRGRAAEELAEQLLFQWDAYAMERPEQLTASAARPRDALLARLSEDGRASQPERR